MKKVYALLFLAALTVIFSGCTANSSVKTSTSQTSTASSQYAADEETDTSYQYYEPVQSPKLADTTYLFNGADSNLAAAKTIERYVELTSDYDLSTFDQAEAKKRLDELKSLKLNGELADDEKPIFDTIAKIAASTKEGTSKVTQLGIFKDTEAEKDPSGLYDTTYQVALTIRTEQNGEVTAESTMVALVWTKGDKIQSSYSIADLDEVVDVTDFFNKMADK